MKITGSGWFELLQGDKSLEVFSKNLVSFCCPVVLVCFGAAVAQRYEKKPPFFSGLSFSDDFGVPVISIADPSLSFDSSVTLGWYAGNSEQKTFQHYVRDFLDALSEVVTGHVVVIGGSGGGFAGLAMNAWETPSNFSTIVWNPQVSITDYYSSYVNRYTKHCWGGGTPKNYPCDTIKMFESNDVVHDLRKKELKTSREIIYLQNFSDSSHYEKHCMSFVKASRLENEGYDGFYRYYTSGNLKVKVGAWGDGHVSPGKSIIYNEIDCVINKRG